jgi:outer membrane protein assembly factor BamE (lipoprotein component of BamABCDE complex)
MFKLKIAGIIVEFENRKAMKIAYDEARAAGKVIEAVAVDPVGPQTERKLVKAK